MTSIAVVTADVLGSQMAGPAMRAVAIAQHLSVDHDVTLVTTAHGTVASPAYACVAVGASETRLRKVLAPADVVIVQGYVTLQARWLLRGSKILVVDLYDPMHFEQLEQRGQGSPDARTKAVELSIEVLNAQLTRGDFFICASERQRALWLGHLAGLGRLNAANYDHDPSLRRLIDVCPFGVPAAVPVQDRHALREGVPGITSTDRIALWAGGLHDWLDPAGVVRAIDLLRDRHDDVRLVFQGTQHPNPDVPEMAAATECRRLADELGLTDKNVFFLPGWVPVDDRQSVLLDADVGVCSHHDHLEATFSFRTRIIDYLWAGVPVVTTRGDLLGDLVAEESLGRAVSPGEPAALADALETMLYDLPARQDARRQVARIRERFTWDRVLQPLAEFCARPRRAPDAMRTASVGSHRPRAGSRLRS